MTATVTNIDYYRAVRELEAATRACEEVTKRTRINIKALKAQTEERRRRIADTLDACPCDVEPGG